MELDMQSAFDHQGALFVKSRPLVVEDKLFVVKKGVI